MTDVEVTEAAMVAAWAHEVMAEVIVVVTEAVVKATKVTEAMMEALKAE